MKGKNLLRRFGGFVLAASIVAGVAMVPGNTVQAQWRGRGGFRGGRVRVFTPIRPFYGYPYGYYNQYVFSNSQAARNQGYKDGLKTGSDDARRGQSNDPERSHYFQNAGFGNFGEVYREGFSRGYSEGFGLKAG